ncbi:stevor PIR protein, putative [Plasmodium reichenowi]|uniref:Stevor PIR protein, putative n=1 Tax=Plasmodium reichenowi TaxID=5854 RepID=A0A2P9D3Z2_PLARE|nr:stevor PIR protein, putative [Plasmodium reichenowi]
MNTYYVKLLLFTFLINTLVLPHNENYQNNHYNVSFIQNNTKRTTIKSRLLAQTQNHYPHYHNDPELKEIIDKLNQEAIKKYQQTHEPYEQLKELVEKNGRKITGGNDAEPMSTTEKDLLVIYEEVFSEGNHIMLKSGMYPNDDDRSDKSSTCECTDNNNAKLAKTKGRDKYLKHLKHRCIRGICICSVGSIFLILIGLLAANAAAAKYFAKPFEAYFSYMHIFNMFSSSTLMTTLQAGGASLTAARELAGSAVGAVWGAFPPYGIAALVLLILAVLLLILYIWLYRRRKNSWKHECKKHLCK